MLSEWRYIDVSWELPVRIAVPEHAQSGAVLSLPGGGFEPRTSAT
jgi:hypothetical protein